MSSFSQKLKTCLAPYHLLKHPFYEKWNRGELSLERLQLYAKEYYQHVEAFPRYISAAHSQSTNKTARRIFLENLNDEEAFTQGIPHPELWKNFAQELEVDSGELKESTETQYINPVIECFFKNCQSSYPRALAAIYAYEYQVPEVAETKIKGLKQHYDIHSKKALSFFEVHKQADIYHREACEKLLDQLSPQDQEEATESALAAATHLWDFLTHIDQAKMNDAA